MANRLELAQKYLELQRDGKVDEAVAMLADDVIASNPMTGTQTGKPAVEEAMRNRPAGAGGMTLEWSEPKEEGDSVAIVGTGSPFGPIKVSVGFNGKDEIDKIEIGLGGDRDALLQHYRTTREELLGAIDGLSDEQMTERSLDGWSVKDHLAHLALWDDVRASEVIRISAGQASAWRMSGEQDGAYNALGYSLRRDLSLEQVRWELANSRRSLLYAIESAPTRGLDGSLYGEAGLLSGHERQHTGWIKRWRSERGI